MVKSINLATVSHFQKSSFSVVILEEFKRNEEKEKEKEREKRNCN